MYAHGAQLTAADANIHYYGAKTNIDSPAGAYASEILHAARMRLHNRVQSPAKAWLSLRACPRIPDAVASLKVGNAVHATLICGLQASAGAATLAAP